jgi:hypothetical protein
METADKAKPEKQQEKAHVPKNQDKVSDNKGDY